MKKSKFLSLLMASLSVLVMSVPISASEPVSTDKVLENLSEEYGVEIRLASQEEMDLVGFTPVSTRSFNSNTIDESVIRKAIEDNEIANAQADAIISSSDNWVVFDVDPTEGNVINIDDQTASPIMSRAYSRVDMQKAWYPNGGFASVICDYDFSSSRIGTVYSLGFGHYAAYENTYHIIPNQIGYSRIDGGRHLNVSCEGTLYVISRANMVVVSSNARRTATIS